MAIWTYSICQVDIFPPPGSHPFPNTLGQNEEKAPELSAGASLVLAKRVFQVVYKRRLAGFGSGHEPIKQRLDGGGWEPSPEKGQQDGGVKSACRFRARL